MSKAKPILKWMHDGPRDYYCDPFHVFLAPQTKRWVAYVRAGKYSPVVYRGASSFAAKRACESLASRIIAATKGRHGK